MTINAKERWKTSVMRPLSVLLEERSNDEHGSSLVGVVEARLMNEHLERSAAIDGDGQTYKR